MICAAFQYTLLHCIFYMTETSTPSGLSSSYSELPHVLSTG